MGLRGRNSSAGSVFGSLSCVMHRRGFDLSLSLRLRGFFALGLSMGFHSIPFKKKKKKKLFQMGA